MSEIEKLRALLAEARGYINTPGYRHSGLEEAIAQRIDAALSEPAVPDYTFRGGYVEDASGDRWWSAELLARTERERDEARAEVVTAYQRGAEAMREAAMGAAWHSAAMGVHAKIRDLPIPEDK